MKFMRPLLGRFGRFVVCVLVVLALSLPCLADSNTDAAAAIVGTASTVFGTVATLMVAIVGFMIILRIVRGVKGR